jgi:sugar phosphate isomerase/epimerase
MKIGVCCTDLNKAAFIKSIGYDFIETSLNGLEKMSEEEFSIALKTLKQADIQVEAVNGFYPSDMQILNLEKSDEIRAYCQKALKRASLLGAEIAVMGSGGARKRPDGMSKEEYKKRLFSLLKIMGEEGEKTGITIVVEPLNFMETNEINFVSECVEVVKELSHPFVRVLADFYHMYKVGEGVESIEKTEGLLAHLHIARANEDRGTPNEEDRKDLENIFKTLRKIGYQGRISIEAAYKDFEKEIAIAYPLLEEVR